MTFSSRASLTMRETQRARSGPLAWPWPADTPLDRSRRVAQSYRALAATVDPDGVAALDTWNVDHGQGWVVEQEWDYDENDLWTLDEVAERCHVQIGTVYRWHQRGLPYTDTPDGLRVRVGDLVTWHRNRRLSRLGGTPA
jgi:hypothetical protein